MGRSIHEIPRQDQSGQDICKTPDVADRRAMEGSMSQVTVTTTKCQQVSFQRPALLTFLSWVFHHINVCLDYSIHQIHSLNQPTIKHNVKSLITSPSKHPHNMPQLEAMERVKYEESKPVRHTSVVNSTASVLRSTHQEASKSQLSPSIYDEANARRTPVNYSTNPVSRGSPMLARVPEGALRGLSQLPITSAAMRCSFSVHLWTVDRPAQTIQVNYI